MTITTASTNLPHTVCSDGAQDLPQHHPARIFFDGHSSHVPGVSAALDVSLKAEWGHKSVGLKSMLGCVIDCASALACPQSLGESDLAELEVDYPHPWRGEPLYVCADVEQLCERCAVFSCELCLASDGTRVGYAQGTLSSRFGD